MEKDTFTYVLTDRFGQVLYIGITNDKQGREKKHRDNGLFFNSLIPTSNLMTRSDAWNKETLDLVKHYEDHNNSLPPYQRNNQQELKRVLDYIKNRDKD